MSESSLLPIPTLNDLERLIVNTQHDGRIQRGETTELCRSNGNQASKLLRRLANEGKLAKSGERRGSYYTLGSNARI